MFFKYKSVRRPQIRHDRIIVIYSPGSVPNVKSNSVRYNDCTAVKALPVMTYNLVKSTERSVPPRRIGTDFIRTTAFHWHTHGRVRSRLSFFMPGRFRNQNFPKFFRRFYFSPFRRDTNNAILNSDRLFFAAYFTYTILGEFTGHFILLECVALLILSRFKKYRSYVIQQLGMLKLTLLR